MEKTKRIDSIGDDLVAIASIIGISVLSLNGITDPFTISVIAGIGGFSVREKRKRRANENSK